MLLSAADMDNLKHFVQDFTIRSLIPYVEKQVVMLNEAVSDTSAPGRIYFLVKTLNLGHQQKRALSVKRHQTMVCHKQARGDFISKCSCLHNGLDGIANS